MKNIARRLIYVIAPLALVLVAGIQNQSAHAQTAPAQVQCASQIGAGNVASQIETSIAGGGGIVPLSQLQCLGQLGSNNTLGQMQNTYGAPPYTYGGAGNYVLPAGAGNGQSLAQIGNNNWALLQKIDLILTAGAGLNISSSTSSPTNINSNSNYLIGR